VYLQLPPGLNSTAVNKIYINKTKIMVQSVFDAHTGNEMKIRGDMTEVGDEFVYLGTCITKCTDEPKDMRRRVGLANNAYSLLPVMKAR